MSDLHFVPLAEARLDKMNAEHGIRILNDYGFRVEWSEGDVSWSNENDPRVFGADFKRDTGGEFPPLGPVGREDAERVYAWLDSFSD